MKEVKIAIELWLEVAKKEGRAIPKPLGTELLRTVRENMNITAV